MSIKVVSGLAVPFSAGPQLWAKSTDTHRRWELQLDSSLNSRRISQGTLRFAQSLCVSARLSSLPRQRADSPRNSLGFDWRILVSFYCCYSNILFRLVLLRLVCLNFEITIVA